MKHEKIFIEDDSRQIIIVKPQISLTNRTYFSITAELGDKDPDIRDKFWDSNKESWSLYTCGCCHEDIEKHFPGEFTDLIALHLSDTEGVPMHAIENGWYWFGHDQRNCIDYLRITLEEYQDLQLQVSTQEGAIPVSGKAAFIVYVAKLFPRWKREAEAAIIKHGLTVPESKTK